MFSPGIVTFAARIVMVWLSTIVFAGKRDTYHTPVGTLAGMAQLADKVPVGLVIIVVGYPGAGDPRWEMFRVTGELFPYPLATIETVEVRTYEMESVSPTRKRPVATLGIETGLFC